MTDWFPVVFIVFKVLVLGLGMFFAVKWHHERAKKESGPNGPESPRAVRKTAAVFMLALVVLLLLTYGVSRMLGMELALS